MQAVIVALITGVFAFAGTFLSVFFANRRSTALITYRIDELEKKVHAHNNLIERTYQIEKTQVLHCEQLKVVNQRIKDLEGAKK